MGHHRAVIRCLEAYYRLTTGKVPCKQDGVGSWFSSPRPVRKCENGEESDGLAMVVSDRRWNSGALPVHDDKKRVRSLRLLMARGGRARCSKLLENVLTPQAGRVVWRGSCSVYTMREKARTL